MAAPIRFLDEWDRLGIDAEIGRDLDARHREPQRHYHGVEHIEAVIGHLDTLGARSTTTVLAAFFHDAIYDPTRSDNEERSATLADSALEGLAEADDVVTIVRATAGHALPAQAPDGCAAFLDADLAILGASEATYDWYAGAIRAEYSHVPTDEFRRRRADVLAGFLERPVLYFTDEARKLWEANARANLTREIEQLRSS